MGKSGKKVDKNGDFPCFFGLAVVVLGYSRNGPCWDGKILREGRQEKGE